MSDRLFLVSGRPSDAQQIARSLRDRGWHVDTETRDNAEACWRISQTKPFAVLISLEFDAQCGCDLACALSVASVTRDIPIIFVGGTREDIDMAMKVAPQARFVDASNVPWELKQLSMRH